MIDFDFYKNCYSCGACANVCPKDAIHFDNFLFPVVNTSLCIDCKHCEQVCVKMNEKLGQPVLGKNAEGLVCKNANEIERTASSSGGIFILLAKKTLEQKGYVCGCVYDDEFMPKHILSNTIDDVKKMMGSKYVKSDMGFCIREMEQVLKNGQIVLFTGVPCQVAAVENCLGKYPNLILANIVCHGSIERDFWESYLSIERERGNILKVTMRDKSKGWENYGLRVSFDNGIEHVTFRNDDGYFLRCFTGGLFERRRCLHCSYKGSAITGDLIMGDGWGMDQFFPDFCDSLGASSVIILSDKGKGLLSSIQRELNIKSIDVDSIIDSNNRIVSPAPDTLFRKQFQRKCRKKPDKLNKYCQEYGNPSLLKKILCKIYAVW